MAKKELGLLREEMEKQGIDWYLIPTDDFHQSEYVGDYFKGREWVSGFTGSAGTLIVGLKEAFLFTDGRYYIQAEKELEGSGIILMRSGTKGVPSPEEFLIEQVKEGETAAFDYRVVSARLGDRMLDGIQKKNAEIRDVDLLHAIWTDRPKRSRKSVYVLEEKYAGESVKSKLERLRAELENRGAQGHILTSLDDIAWLYNLRGSDVKNSPLFLAYSYVTMTRAYLFLQPEVLEKEAKDSLKEAGVEIGDYDKVYDFLAEQKEKTVLMDVSCISSKMKHGFSSDVSLIESQNPTAMMKAVKNEVEISNLKNCHIKDGVAVTRFIYWLKKQVLEEKREITEVEAADYLDGLRRQIDGCTDLSFPTIAAFGANGAMMHYSAKKEDCAVLKPGNFFLVDSGGQYPQGTTDVTRTIVLGEIGQEEKKNFTAVARGMLNLMGAKFLEGCHGVNLDILAREPMWEMGIDYRCGTGHGVGYFLNVHEGPNAFRWKMREDLADCELKPGMVTTDEPGIYLTGEYGIRTENELLCVEDEENEYGRFLKFEPLTYVPIDLCGIDPSYMNEKEKRLLNEYHKQVYEKLAPYLCEEEKNWLMTCTKPAK